MEDAILLRRSVQKSLDQEVLDLFQAFCDADVDAEDVAFVPGNAPKRWETAGHARLLKGQDLIRRRGCAVAREAFRGEDLGLLASELGVQVAGADAQRAARQVLFGAPACVLRYTAFQQGGGVGVAGASPANVAEITG